MSDENTNIICYKKFVASNGFIALLLSLCYIPNAVDLPHNITELVFLLTTHIGYITILSLACAVVLSPIVFLHPIFMYSLLVIGMPILLMALLLDIIVYWHFKIHLSVISPALLALKATDFQRFESIIFLAVFVVLLFFEIYLVNKSIKKTSKYLNAIKKNDNSYLYLYALAVSICMLVSYTMFNFSKHDTQQKFVKNVSYMAFFQATAELNPVLKLKNLDNKQKLPVSKLLLPQLYKQNYNLKPIIYNQVTAPQNILILAIDAWRADRFNATDTPCLWQYAQKGKIFTNHMAAANNTKASLFGLLYGIPADYFEFFSATRQTPILMDRLQQLDYQIGFFYSNDIELDEKVYLGIKNIRLGSTAATPALRDHQATDDWLNWFANCNKDKPSFSFIFYDSVHEYDFPPEFNEQHTPCRGEKRYAEIAAEYGRGAMNEMYNISVNYVDSLAGKVLAKLAETGELENTLVIITSDHGHELDDYNHKFWGHGSNLSVAQTHVPLAIIDKKFNNAEQPIECNKLTSHFDLVPTLLASYLGATNNTEDYSIGYNLLKDNLEHDWVLVSGRDKYLNYFGVCDENYRIKLLHSGFYQLFDINNNVLSEIEINYQQINQAFNYIKKFIH